MNSSHNIIKMYTDNELIFTNIYILFSNLDFLCFSFINDIQFIYDDFLFQLPVLQLFGGQWNSDGGE